MADAPIVVASDRVLVSTENGEAAAAASPRPFAHLHCHTQFSLLDGANRIGDYVKKVKESGMTACAMTDHGNMYGALEFYNVCKEAGVNPVIGFEAYIAPGHRTDRSANKQKDAAYHLTLLAQNATGFKNLCKMSSLAFLEGFHYRPRIDKELLERHAEGVICLSGCASSELSDFLLGERTDEAERLIQWYLKVFGDRFYMEIQNAGFQIQKECADRTIDVANRMGLPLVATNDAHYLNKEDAEAHDVLLCVNTRTFRSDANRMKMESNQLFVRTPEEMYAAFPGQEAAVAMSQEIADRIDIDLDLKTRHYPVFRPPENKTDTEYLRELCLKGMVWRYGDDVTEAHRKRLDFELGVIDKMGYSSYFLIVWDFVRFAMENDIPAGARGSAVGAIVAYLLGLSHVCPIQYDLLFERFLDPKRTEPPDIDIDFCRDGRQAVIDYTKRKYGNANVSQIGTYGTLKAKLVIRDVCRALSVPLSRADEVAKMVPEDPKMTLKKALDESAELKDAYDKDPQIKEVIDLGKRLEGLVRSAGTHAAGVVVADKPLIDYIPLQTISGKEDLVTQWDGPTVEKAGLLKMDFLGLRNLSILHKAVQNVKKFKGVEINPIKLPLDDKRTFALLQRGETKGVFQLESGGMRDLLTKMKPDKFHDIIATSALYRPGPLEGGLVMQYVDVKNGRMPTPKVHPIIDEILDETYGVMVYQEQVMRILNRLGGIELPSSYACIKAISKKKLKTIAEFREKFIEGSQTQGLDKKTATELFEMIEKFAGYGFNKCVVASTEIIDATTGERTTVGDLFRNRREFTIHSLGDDFRLRPRAVTDVMWNGRKRVYELRTSQGKRIRATSNHPFRTLDGWRNLGELKPGDRIASPRALSVPTQVRWKRHEVIALAWLLSEGNLCHPSCLYVYNDTQSVIDDVKAAFECFPDTVARIDRRVDGKRMEVCVSTGRDMKFRAGQTPWNASRRAESESDTVFGLSEERASCATIDPPRTRRAARSGAWQWAESLDILGRKADQKHVPDCVFALCDADLELFLGRLWAGDGFVGREGQMPFYATSSERLARDVQTLLMRLGIVSGVHSKVFQYRRGGVVKLRPAYTVHLVGTESVLTFVRRVLPHTVGRKEQIARLTAHLDTLPADRTSKDTVPAEIRAWVDEERRAASLGWRELEAQSGVSIRELCRKNTPGLKRGFRRSTIQRLAEFFSSARLEAAASSDVFWDTVVVVEACGLEDTYDLTVDEDHNFAADGLIVHNSHSTAYGAVAYQTAYLKANYPVEFMAALLSCEMENTDRISEHVDDARRMGLPVERPDLNSSDVEFLPSGDKIIFGLGAIKGLGENVAHAIVDERRANGPFKSIYDLTERVDPKILSKGMLEILVKAGTLDVFGPNREQHTLAIERAVQGAIAKQRDKARGQKSLFGDDAPAQGSDGAATDAAGDVLPDAPDWSHRIKLASEKEVFGFYLSSHPLAECAGKFEKFAQHSTGDLPYVEDRSDVFLGGMISSIKKAQVKKANRNGNTRYVNFDLEDEEGVVRCIMWPDEFARIGHKVTADTLCFIKGKVEKRGREPNVTVNALYTVPEAEAEFTRQVAVKLQRGLHTQDDMTRVRDVMQRFPGRTDVVLVVYSVDEKDPDQKVRYVLAGPASLKVKPSDEFREAMTAALGESNFDFVAPPRKRIVRPAKPIEAAESGASFQQPARAMATADVGDVDEEE